MFTFVAIMSRHTVNVFRWIASAYLIADHNGQNELFTGIIKSTTLFASVSASLFWMLNLSQIDRSGMICTSSNRISQTTMFLKKMTRTNDVCFFPFSKSNERDLGNLNILEGSNYKEKYSLALCAGIVFLFKLSIYPRFFVQISENVVFCVAE